MQRQEIDYLKDKKLRENKSNIEINKEINNLKESLKGFNLLKRENLGLKKQVENRDREITRLKEEINKQKKKVFDLTIKKDIEKDEEISKKSLIGRTANVHHLKRIVEFLKENPNVIKTRIKESCCIGFDQLNSGLIFLQRMRIVREVNGGYCINGIDN